MKFDRLQSLRLWLLVPLIGVAAMSATAVAVVSFQHGVASAESKLLSRFSSIQQAIAAASFPLTDSVLDSIAALTDTELIAVGVDGRYVRGTPPLRAIRTWRVAVDTSESDGGSQRGSRSTSAAPRPDRFELELGGSRYTVLTIDRRAAGATVDRVAAVYVLFDRDTLAAERRSAAMLPLATGLSTILLLTTVSLLMNGRLIRRLDRLQHRVERVARGDFETQAADAGRDEIGRLSRAVEAMARQLQQLWEAVNRQQRERLLHQIAGGMAHQLRNALTGARMAVELHQRTCAGADREGLEVAVREIANAEQYIRKLTQSAAGTRDVDQPADVLDCLWNVRPALDVVAKHRQLELHWQIDEQLTGWQVADGASFAAAVGNLVLNAMDAGSSIWVTASQSGEGLRLEVADDGPGVNENIRSEIFEAFTTDKPNGMGLGLSLVRRVTERLGGSAGLQSGRPTTFYIVLPLDRGRTSAGQLNHSDKESHD